MGTTTEPATPCRIIWWVYVGDSDSPGGRQRIRRTATMRGTWGYDAECTTHGWDSRTGGAVRSYVAREVWAHKYFEQGKREGRF